MPDPFEGIDFSEYTTKPAPLAPTAPVQSAPTSGIPEVSGTDPFANEDFSAFSAAPAPLAEKVRPLAAAKAPMIGSERARAKLMQLVRAQGSPATADDYAWAEESALKDALSNNDVHGAEEIVDMGLNRTGLRKILGSFNTSMGDIYEQSGGMSRMDQKRLYDAVDAPNGVNRADRLLALSREANAGNNPQAQAIYETLRNQYGLGGIDNPDTGTTDTTPTEQFLGNFQGGAVRTQNAIGASALALGGQGNYFPEAARESAAVQPPAPVGFGGQLAATLGGGLESVAEGVVAGPLAAGAKVPEAALPYVAGAIPSVAPALNTYGQGINEGDSQGAAIAKALSNFALDTATEGAGGIRGADRLSLVSHAAHKPKLGDILAETGNEVGGEHLANVLENEASRQIDNSDGRYYAPQLPSLAEALGTTIVAGGSGAAGMARHALTDSFSGPPQAQMNWAEPDIQGPQTPVDALKDKMYGEISDAEASKIQEEIDNAENQAPEIQNPEPVADQEVAQAKPQDLQDVTDTNVDISTPTAFDQELAAKQDQETPPPVAKATIAPQETSTTPGPEFLSPLGRRAYNSLTELERQSPEITSTLEAISRNPDPQGDAANILMARDIARNKRMKPKPAAPLGTKIEENPQPSLQQEVNFNEPSAPAQESQTALAAMAPVVQTRAPAFPQNQARGSLKGRYAARKFFGPALSNTKAPQGATSQGVRVFKDAGVHNMYVKPLVQGLHVAVDPGTGKALVVAKTDSKGRRDENGTELRPLNAQGEIQTVAEDNNGLQFQSLEDAVRFAGRNFVKNEVDQGAAESAAQEVGGAENGRDAALNVRQGKNIGVTKKAASRVFEAPAPTAERSRQDKQNRLQFLSDKATRGSMTDQELDEADALEAEMSKTPALEAPRAYKAVPNSPLTPKLRQDIADSVTQDMPEKNVGILVKNMLEQSLRREPTQPEVLAALKDLSENEIYKGAVAPGKSVEAHALNFTPLVNTLAKIAGVNPTGWLRQRFQDLELNNSAFTDLNEAVKPGQFGYTPRQIAKFITKALGMRGRGGAWVVDAATKLTHLFTARTVAAMFPQFRPVLKLATSQIDRSRLAYQEAFDALTPFKNLTTDAKFKVNGALITFRLEDRAPSEFDKPVKYTDEQGREHLYTLTPKQQGIVKLVYGTNKQVLTDYVDVLRQVFGIPASVQTTADLAREIAAGTLPPSAKMLEAPMKVLETGKDNYVPLKRFGDKYHAVIYDAARYNAARTAAQRKAAELGFIKAESNADLNRQVEDAGQRFPGAYVLAYEDREAVQDTRSPVSPKDLLALADIANVPPNILQDFLDAGVQNYLETRGIGARFAEAKKVPGFNHDMLRAVASHLQAMTQATERLRHRHLMELSTKQIDDPELKRFAQRFMERIDTPVGQLAQGVRQLTTLYYLGLGAVSALVNSTTSLFMHPATLFQATKNPAIAARAFGHAVREQFNALAHIFGNGLPIVGRGMSQVDQTIERYNRSNPRLATALQEADKAGVFSNVFDRESEEIAKRGEEGNWSKIRDQASKALMHFFAKVETANRLSAFVAAFQTHEENSGHPPYDKFMDKIGFTKGGNAAEFAEFFSDFQNFRMDKTDMPSWAQGTFKKNAVGKEVFTPSTLRPMAYALKGYSVNFLQQQMLVMRAALSGGWIDKALYGALLASFLATFGAVNMVPGLQTLDALHHKVTGDLHTVSETMKSKGGASRALATGWPGMLAEHVVSDRVGEVVDELASRSGSGNVIPSSVDPMQIFAPLSVANGMYQGMGNLASGDKEQMIEGAGQMLGKEPAKIARFANQMTGNRGYTTKAGNTLVPDESTAVKGAPFLSTGDMFLALAGGQPPVVRDAYRSQQVIRDMKTANDSAMETAVLRAADGIFAHDQDRVNAAIQGLQRWNQEALDRKEPWKLITGDAFKQALIIEVQQRSLGARNLRPVPKGGRPQYLQNFEETTPEENIKP